MLNYKSILVTGGTGSFGQKFVETVLTQFPNITRLVVYSRDELKQFNMSNKFPEEKYPGLRFFIGDVRDGDRLRRACEGIDVVIHAAALKQVPAAEYNPMEFIKTNILGAENVVNAAMDMGVKRVVALSTDKAAAPVNLYGATKLCSDKLFVAANNIKGKRDLKFSVVRYGNVLGSRGSVVPFFLEKRKNNVIPITHEKMTRFSITLEHGIQVVLDAVNRMWGGEVFVPKIPSYRILDLAQAIAPNCKLDYVGIRPGEKLHEEMVTEMDSFNTIEFDRYFTILSRGLPWSEEEYMQTYKGKRVPDHFSYNSGNNTEWLSVEQLRSQIRKHVDPEFNL